jgi:hypothetical protein
MNQPPSPPPAQTNPPQRCGHPAHTATVPQPNVAASARCRRRDKSAPAAPYRSRPGQLADQAGGSR